MGDEVKFIKQVDDAQKDLIKTLDTKLAFTKAEARLRVLSTKKEEIRAEMDTIEATLDNMSTSDYVLGNLFRFFGATSSVDLENQLDAQFDVYMKLVDQVDEAEKQYDKLFKQNALSSITGGPTPTTPRRRRYNY